MTCCPLIPQAKLRALKQYVVELRESYDELLRAFSQLEGAAKDKVMQLEAKLATALATAKVRLSSLHVGEDTRKLVVGFSIL